VSIDTTLIGEAAAQLMEKLSDVDGELVAVGIVAIRDIGGNTCTTTYCTDDLDYRQVGLFEAGLDSVRMGEFVDWDEEVEAEDE
jgi:hypothetical protein